MKTVVKDYVTRFEKNHKRRNRFIAMFLCLSLLTSLVVNRELAGTGIAATADYICGQEEHTHDESCYELACGLEGEKADLDFATLYEDERLGTLEAANAYEEQLNAYNEQLNSQSESSEGEELYSETPTAPVHVHDASCYKLVCDITPHVHSAECIAPTDEDENSENGENDINAISEDGESSEDSEVSAQDLDFDKDDTIDENEHNAHPMVDVATNLNFTVQKYNTNNKKWETLESGATITDGDELKTTITYTIPHSVVTEKAYIITYNLPEGFDVSNMDASVRKGYVSGTIGTVSKGGTSAEDSWGIYSIDDSGHIQIAFNESFFATNDDFSGGLTIQGKAKVNGTSEVTTITFDGNGPTFNIVPKAEAKDLSVTKTAGKVKDGKITYTVTATSTTGTDNAVNIEDTIWMNGLNSVTIGDVKVVDANGNPVTPTSSTISGNSMKLELPKFESAGTYTITYTADVSDIKEWTDGSASVGNSVVAKDGSNEKGRANTSSVVQDPLINKQGWINGTNTGIVWTVTINQNKSEDVAGEWQISDTLDSSSIDWSKVTDLKVIKTDKNNIQTDVKDEFVNNNYSKLNVEAGCSYTITYTTPVEIKSEEYKVTNSAIVVPPGDGKHYKSDGTVVVKPKDEFPSKQTTGSSTAITNTTTREQGWSVTLNPTAGSSSTIVIEDSLYDENENYNADVHWSTLTELNKWFKANTVEYTASIVGYDVNGNQVTDENAKVVRFKLTLTPKTTWSGNTITPTYYSVFETKDMNDGDTIAVVNKAQNENGIAHESKATYTKSSTFNKYLVSKPNSYTTNYISGSTTVDYTKLEDKKLTYRIYLKPSDNNEITVTDTIPEGMTLSADDVSVKLVSGYDDNSSNTSGHYDDNGNWVSYDLNAEGNKPTITVSEDNVLTVVIPAGRPSAFYDAENKASYAIDYTVTVTDEYWESIKNNDKTYTNVAKWGDKVTKVDTEIKRTVDTLQKTGEQIKDASGKVTNSIRYWVIINPTGETLNDGNPIKLTDKMKKSDEVKVSVDLANVKLYSYNYKNAENHYIGSEIDSDVFTSSYDESTNTFNMTIPDGTAMVLSYVYTVDNMNNQKEISLSNSVTLEGKTTISKENKVTVQEASSSAYVTKTNTLTIVKVDEDRYQKPLPGAEFDVYQYSNSVWSKINESSLVTNDKGTTSFSLKNITRDTLYYFQETKAPEGYSLSDKKYYFVPLDSNTAVDTWVSANSVLMNTEGITKSDIIFIEYNGYGTVYVPNKLTTLQVKKLWFDYEGNEVSGTQDIQVQLYQNTKYLEYKTVTVCWYTGPSDNMTLQNTTEIQVKPGTEFTFSSRYWNNWGALSLTRSDTGESYTLYGDSDSVVTQSIGVINDDITLSLHCIDNVYNAMNAGDLSCTYTEAEWVSDDAVPYGEPITLSKSNGYTYKWEDLPTANDGKEIYYTVQEITDLGSSYTVTYVNNTGVQTGVITVNNKKNTKSEPYKLPETGGSGTTPYLFSGLAIMAASLTVIYLKRRKGEGKA